MNLSKYDILSCARLSFDFSFHNKEKNLDAFENYETTEDSGTVFLKTKSLNYAAAKTELAKIYMLIKQHATTEWDNFVQVNISFDENISKIYQLNALKLILSTNEDVAYNNFPDRKNRVGSRSVGELIKPGINSDSARLSLSSSIYAIDLSKIAENIVSYRYIGGKDYQDKFEVSSILIDKWILDLYYIVEYPSYTAEETEKLSKLSKTENIDDVFVSYKTFKDKYNKVNVLVDLNPIEGKENIFWATIKERLAVAMKSLAATDKKMTINYDTDEGRLQIKDAKLYGVSGLNDVDVIDCVISGDVSHLSVYYCHMVNANADFCDFFNGCDIMKSKLYNCYLSDGCTTNDSLIDGDSTVSGRCSNCTLTEKVKYTKSAHLKDCKNNATKI